jgi:hypothetical protein
MKSGWWQTGRGVSRQVERRQLDAMVEHFVGRTRYDRASSCREVTPMHKYGAPTALAIALITMLALAVSMN